jgi:hypothetical protein
MYVHHICVAVKYNIAVSGIHNHIFKAKEEDNSHITLKYLKAELLFKFIGRSL